METSLLERLFFIVAFASLVGFAQTRADETRVVATILTPQTPIVIASNNVERATKLQELDVSAFSRDVREIIVTVSEPKFLKRLEVRVGNNVLGRYDFDNVFNVDYNAPTMPTQIPIQLDPDVASAALQESGVLAIWTVPSELAGPETKIKVGVVSISTKDAYRLAIKIPVLEYRFGVLVRDSGWDNVAQYRIPGIVRSNKGTLVACYDVRRAGFPDLPADIDVGVSRSLDGGKTWEPMRIAIDFKGNDERLEGVGDPAILVDATSGRIWLAALWGHNGKSIAQSEPGLEFGKSGQLVLAYSDDDGVTWSKPRNITQEVALGKDWRLLFQGPGSGICARDGKLVFPAQFFDKERVGWSTIVWSDDSGATWRVGTGARKGTCEAQVVELNDGALMLNMRNYGVNLRERTVAITRDLGETWSEYRPKEALPCPICQASLIRVRSTKDGDASNLLAFMNPNSDKNRVDMTVKLSEDEGATWSRALTLYRSGCCGYSSLVKIDADTIGAFYETIGGLIYQTIKLDDIR